MKSSLWCCSQYVRRWRSKSSLQTHRQQSNKMKWVDLSCCHIRLAAFVHSICLHLSSWYSWLVCMSFNKNWYPFIDACMHACIVILMQNAIRIALECTNGNRSIKCHLTSCIAPYTKRTITIHDFNLLTRQMVFIWKCLKMQKKKKQ